MKSTGLPDPSTREVPSRVSVPSRGNSGAGACPYDRCCPEAELPAEGSDLVLEARGFPGYTGESDEPGPSRGCPYVPDADDEVSASGPVSGSIQLSEGATAVLLEFPRDMFAMPKNAPRTLQSPGYLIIQLCGLSSHTDQYD